MGKAFSSSSASRAGVKTSLEQKLELAKRGAVEVVTEPELRELLKRGELKAYCGYEPSGKIHFGHALTAWKLADLQELGAEVKVLLADLHAWLNHKGELEEIRKVAEYNRHCFIALGLDPRRTEFVLGSEFQLQPEYMLEVLKLATDTTLLRARRSMSLIARRLENPDVAQVVYPLMQAVDIAWLDIDLAVGGLDQRKVHMIAREKLPKLGRPKPVCLHTPLLHGLDGAAKMSSSKGNFVAVDDEPEVIRRKIERAYCPPKQARANPVVELAEHVVLPRQKLVVKRHRGPEFEVEDPEQLKLAYERGELHPADLKPALVEAIVGLLAPVREYFEKHPEARLTEPISVL